jgi:putative cell wall-binding protein
VLTANRVVVNPWGRLTDIDYTKHRILKLERDTRFVTANRVVVNPWGRLTDIDYSEILTFNIGRGNEICNRQPRCREPLGSPNRY